MKKRLQYATLFIVRLDNSSVIYYFVFERNIFGIITSKQMPQKLFYNIFSEKKLQHITLRAIPPSKPSVIARVVVRKLFPEMFQGIILQDIVI